MGEYDGGNIFAKILRGETPCVKIFEDDDVLAFMDIFPPKSGPLPSDPEERHVSQHHGLSAREAGCAVRSGPEAHQGGD
jgi:diadenosine tetraphosphate (Ap4A) HIT family hydrolase